MQRLLVLVRHGQSEWNLKNLFTGWKDPALTELGVEEARAAGQVLKAKGISFDRGYSSNLARARNTLKIILTEIGQPDIPALASEALNERDYGELTGLDKDEARRKWGDAQVRLWRRSYDVRPPNGESLKDTVARALPFYCEEILPRLLRGECILIVAHGNSLRALLIVLDQLTPQGVAETELATGTVLLYRLREDSTVEEKEVLKS
jgi:2,3-bisphosphoglycerate-dependent phosphoglycerate mutase